MWNSTFCSQKWSTKNWMPRSWGFAGWDEVFDVTTFKQSRDSTNLLLALLSDWMMLLGICSHPVNHSYWIFSQKYIEAATTLHLDTLTQRIQLLYRHRPNVQSFSSHCFDRRHKLHVQDRRSLKMHEKKVWNKIQVLFQLYFQAAPRRPALAGPGRHSRRRSSTNPT